MSVNVNQYEKWSDIYLLIKNWGDYIAELSKNVSLGGTSYQQLQTPWSETMRPKISTHMKSRACGFVLASLENTSMDLKQIWKLHLQVVVFD